MTELLPCPFCGGDAFTGETLTSLYVVLCRGCGAETGAWDTEAEAIAAWNQRVDTEAAMREKIMKEINDYDPSPFPSLPR